MTQQTSISELQKRRLAPSSVDLASTKTQMLLGSLFVGLSSVLAYAGTLSIGFLGQETAALQSLASALNGSFSLLQSQMENLCFLDYSIFHGNYAGYHCVNILLATVCAIFVGLIALELTGRLGNRNGAVTAFWAGLLFSVYPLHAATLAPVIGRYEILGALFYLISLFLFLRYRLIEEKKLYLLSLLSAAIALLCQPQSLTLAVVITAFAIHPAVPPFAAERNSSAFKCSAPYWLLNLLAWFFLWSHNETNIFDFKQIDKNIILQIFVPVNQSITTNNILIAVVPLAAALVVLLLKSVIAGQRSDTGAEIGTKSIQPPSSTITCMILLLWLALSTLLSAGDHYFLSAAPLSILLALCALESGNNSSSKAKMLFVCGLVALSSLYLSWSYLLTLNLKPFIQASKIVDSYRKQVTVLKILHGQLLLVNLPSNRGPVSPIGNLDNLKRFLAPPFSQTDISQNLLLVKEKNQYNKALLTAARELYLWDNADQVMLPLPVPSAAEGQNSYQFRFTDLNYLKNCGWQTGLPGQWQNASRAEPVISPMDGVASLRTFDQPAIFWLPFKIQHPITNANLWYLQVHTGDRNNKITVVTRDVDTAFDVKHQGLPGESKTDGLLQFNLSASDTYMLSHRPQQIGLRLGANQNMSVTLIELTTGTLSQDKTKFGANR